MSLLILVDFWRCFIVREGEIDGSLVSLAIYYAPLYYISSCAKIIICEVSTHFREINTMLAKISAIPIQPATEGISR